MGIAARVKDLDIINAYLNNGGCQEKAFLECGYSPKYSTKQAWAFFNKPHVKEIIEKRMKKMEDKLGIKKEWCLLQLKNVIETGSHADIIRAVAEINKMLDHYAPEKHEMKVDIDIQEIIKAKEETQKKYERPY